MISRPTALIGGLLGALYTGATLYRFSEHGPGFKGSDSYSRIAQQVLEQGGFETSFRPPLYPLFLAAMMQLFGSNWELGAVCVQGVAALVLGILVFKTAERLGGSIAHGGIALALYLTNLTFQFEVMAKRETVFFTLAMIVFLAAPLFIHRLWTRYLTMACCAACALLMRPNAIILIPIFLAFAFVDRKRPDFSFGAVCAAALLFVLTLLPWQLFVYRQTGSFPVTTSTNSGQTLWKGNNQYLFSVFPWVDVDILEAQMSAEIGGLDITSSTGDKELKSQAGQFMLNNKLLTIRNAFIKAALFFAPVPIPMGKGDITIDQGTATLSDYRYRSFPLLVFSTAHSLLLWIGWVGFALAPRASQEWRKYAVVSVLLTVFLLGIHVLTYPESRYRWPLDIFLTILSANYLCARFGFGAAREETSSV